MVVFLGKHAIGFFMLSGLGVLRLFLLSLFSFIRVGC